MLLKKILYILSLSYYHKPLYTNDKIRKTAKARILNVIVNQWKDGEWVSTLDENIVYPFSLYQGDDVKLSDYRGR